MLKTELHSHSDDDPFDLIPHTTNELIDRAVESIRKTIPAVLAAVGLAAK